MSHMTVAHAVTRILATPSEEHSQLAVFRTGLDGIVDVVFASTVITQERIAQNDPRYVGTFDGMVDRGRLTRRLQLAAEFEGQS